MRIDKDNLTDERIWQIILLQTPAVILGLLLVITVVIAIFEYCLGIVLFIDLFRMTQVTILSNIIIAPISITLYTIKSIK